MNTNQTLKTYRASARILEKSNKNCPICRDRIRVGQPIQFAPAGCTHARCVVSLEATRREFKDSNEIEREWAR